MAGTTGTPGMSDGGEVDLTREEALGRLAELESVVDGQRDEIGMLRLQLEMLSATDVVTGLPNFTGIMQTVEKEVARHQRTGEAFGLMSVEIPALGRVELHGQGALQDALRHCGAMISAGLRQSDTVGRIDELTFVAALPMMSKEGATTVVHRIDTNLQAMALTFGDETVKIIPSFAAGYPYAGKILFLHMGSPALASPAGDRVIEMLRDPERVPLFIASDIVIGETSMYADYILPDLTFLERWGTPHTTPDVPTSVSKVRQPAAAPLTEVVEVDGEQMPICLETFLIATAKRMQLPGFGKDALGAGLPLDRAEDWFLKLVANIAAGDKLGEAVPEADEEELRIFREARTHLPASVFDEQRWRKAVRADEWPRIVHVLNRGGRFLEFEHAYDGLHMKKRMGKMFHLFMEKVAATRNSMSGELFRGTPSYRGQSDAAGNSLAQEGRYPFRLITYKEPFGGQSRTISNYWGNIALRPENTVMMARRDAERMGVSRGDLVRLRSASAPDGLLDLEDGRILDLVAPVQPVEGMRPGVVGVSWHYGHWAYGSNDVVVDGVDIAGDERRAAGICPNPLMAVEPALGDVCLTDPIGGSASFFDTFVAVEPAGRG